MIITVIEDKAVSIFMSKKQAAKFIGICLKQFYNIIGKNDFIEYRGFKIYLNCELHKNKPRGKKGF